VVKRESLRQAGPGAPQSTSAAARSGQPVPPTILIGMATKRNCLPTSLSSCILLDHADAVRQPNVVRRIPPFLGIVHADQIGGEQGDLAVDHPLRRVGGDVGALLSVAWRRPYFVDACPADERGSRPDISAPSALPPPPGRQS